ncbi:CPBP family glutamic-type intramembrane protease [Bacillus mycoides]|uniref:CPBP family glutamic-type intramembrane protease n=1 Tax=Bacillus mycoides TaxID=1405 RepID=UPI003CC7F041
MYIHFSFIHNIPMEYRVFPFVLSIVTSYVYRKTNSLLAQILIHYIWNLTSII